MEHHHYKASLSLQLCVSSGSNNLFMLVVKEYLRASPSVIRTPPKPTSLLYKAYLSPLNFIDIDPVLKVNIAKHCSQSSAPHPSFPVYTPTPFFPKISIQFSSKSHNVIAIFHHPHHYRSDHSPAPTCRQSMRAMTPASTNPKFICPSNDSRKAPKVVMLSESDQPGPPSKKKAPIILAAPFVLAKKTRTATTAPTQVSKRKGNNLVEVDLEPSSDGVETLMDLTQDLDQENAKVTKKPRQKTKHGESELDDVNAFFHPPTFARL
ncbi:hypothetical protein MJO29_001005 [Puccinia striiformis f. sp. tritici]|nr:hypothetical protein MJO29_001005 [Puccinia striiformis f. sp. tritici]